MIPKEEDKPTFKEFWEHRKHIVQFVGIICALGALFLAIPAPENFPARTALQNIQFIWLVFIGFSLLVLAVNIYSYISKVETYFQNTHRTTLFLQGTPSFIFISLLITFGVNLWSYAKALYTQPLDHFLGICIVGSFALLIFLIEFLVNKYKEKLGKLTSILIKAFFASVLIMLGLSFQMVFSAETFYKLKTLDWWVDILTYTPIIFSSILLFEAYFEFRKTNVKIEEGS